MATTNTNPGVAEEKLKEEEDEEEEEKEFVVEEEDFDDMTGDCASTVRARCAVGEVDRAR